MEYFAEKLFEKKDFAVDSIAPGEYEDCTFKQCNLSGVNLARFQFVNCRFIDCNLSLAVVQGTAFQDVIFERCKILGVAFDGCNSFNLSFSFKDCLLNQSVFYRLKLKKTKFENCQLHECDFSETDLSGSVFDGSDFKNAVFENTILEKTDFRSAVNYSINPEKNKIKKARFSLHGVVGLLDQYDIDISA